MVAFGRRCRFFLIQYVMIILYLTLCKTINTVVCSADRVGVLD